MTHSRYFALKFNVVISAMCLTMLLGILPWIYITRAHAAPSVRLDAYQTRYSSASWVRPGAEFFIEHQGNFYICTVGFPATNHAN